MVAKRQDHPHWGSFSNTAQLPNVSGSPTQSSDLAVGDQAYVTGVSSNFQCTNATVGAAVWGSVGNIFEADTGNNEIQPITLHIGRSFIVGSQSKDDSGPANDDRMFFDKGNASFRAGVVDADQWDSGNRGAASFACGEDTIASGDHSHAEGLETQALGSKSHTEGLLTIAREQADHAEGINCIADSQDSFDPAYGGNHAEGSYCDATGTYGCHAEGFTTTAGGQASHAEGWGCRAFAKASHAQGDSTDTVGVGSFTWGRQSKATNDYSEATAGNLFVTKGDGQNIRLNAGTTTTSATPKELSTSYVGSVSDVNIINNAIWGFTARVLGRTSPGDGDDSYFAILEGIVVRSGTSVSLVPGPSPLSPRLEVSSAGASGWSAYIEDNTDSVFKIVVVGDGSKTVRWVAHIEATEIFISA